MMNKLAHLLVCAGLALGASKPGVKEVRTALDNIAWDTIGRTTEPKAGVVDVRPILRVEDFNIDKISVKGSNAKVFTEVTVRVLPVVGEKRIGSVKASGFQQWLYDLDGDFTPLAPNELRRFKVTLHFKKFEPGWLMNSYDRIR